MSFPLPLLPPDYLPRKAEEARLTESILNERSRDYGSLSSNNVSILLNRESFEDASVGKSVLMLAVAHKLIASKQIHKAVWLDLSQYRFCSIPYLSILKKLIIEIKSYYSVTTAATAAAGHGSGEEKFDDYDKDEMSVHMSGGNNVLPLTAMLDNIATSKSFATMSSSGKDDNKDDGNAMIGENIDNVVNELCTYIRSINNDINVSKRDNHDHSAGFVLFLDHVLHPAEVMPFVSLGFKVVISTRYYTSISNLIEMSKMNNLETNSGTISGAMPPINLIDIGGLSTPEMKALVKHATAYSNDNKINHLVELLFPFINCLRCASLLSAVAHESSNTPIQSDFANAVQSIVRQMHTPRDVLQFNDVLANSKIITGKNTVDIDSNNNFTSETHSRETGRDMVISMHTKSDSDMSSASTTTIDHMGIGIEGSTSNTNTTTNLVGKIRFVYDSMNSSTNKEHEEHTSKHISASTRSDRHIPQARFALKSEVNKTRHDYRMSNGEERGPVSLLACCVELVLMRMTPQERKHFLALCSLGACERVSLAALKAMWSLTTERTLVLVELLHKRHLISIYDNNKLLNADSFDTIVAYIEATSTSNNSSNSNTDGKKVKTRFGKQSVSSMSAAFNKSPSKNANKSTGGIQPEWSRVNRTGFGLYISLPVDIYAAMVLLINTGSPCIIPANLATINTEGSSNITANRSTLFPFMGDLALPARFSTLECLFKHASSVPYLLALSIDHKAASKVHRQDRLTIALEPVAARVESLSNFWRHVISLDPSFFAEKGKGGKKDGSPLLPSFVELYEQALKEYLSVRDQDAHTLLSRTDNIGKSFESLFHPHRLSRISTCILFYTAVIEIFYNIDRVAFIGSSSTSKEGSNEWNYIHRWCVSKASEIMNMLYADYHGEEDTNSSMGDHTTPSTHLGGGRIRRENIGSHVDDKVGDGVCQVGAAAIYHQFEHYLAVHPQHSQRMKQHAEATNSSKGLGLLIEDVDLLPPAGEHACFRLALAFRDVDVNQSMSCCQYYLSLLNQCQSRTITYLARRQVALETDGALVQSVTNDDLGSAMGLDMSTSSSLSMTNLQRKHHLVHVSYLKTHVICFYNNLLSEAFQLMSSLYVQQGRYEEAQLSVDSAIECLVDALKSHPKFNGNEIEMSTLILHPHLRHLKSIKINLLSLPIVSKGRDAYKMISNDIMVCEELRRVEAESDPGHRNALMLFSYDTLLVEYCSQLGTVLMRLQKPHKAVKAYEEALHLCRGLYGEYHPTSAVCMEKLGLACYAVTASPKTGDRQGDGQVMLRRSMASRQMMLGLEHPSIARVLHLLILSVVNTSSTSNSSPEELAGILLFLKKVLKNLLNNHRTESPVLRKITGYGYYEVGDSHLVAVIVLRSIARLCNMTARPKEAKAFYKRCLDVIVQDTLIQATTEDTTTDNATTTAAYAVTGSTLVLYKDVIRYPQHYQLGITYKALADINVKSNRYGKAVDNYHNALLHLYAAWQQWNTLCHIHAHREYLQSHLKDTLLELREVYSFLSLSTAHYSNSTDNNGIGASGAAMDGFRSSSSADREVLCSCLEYSFYGRVLMSFEYYSDTHSDLAGVNDSTTLSNESGDALSIYSNQLETIRQSMLPSAGSDRLNKISFIFTAVTLRAGVGQRGAEERAQEDIEALSRELRCGIVSGSTCEFLLKFASLLSEKGAGLDSTLPTFYNYRFGSRTNDAVSSPEKSRKSYELSLAKLLRKFVKNQHKALIQLNQFEADIVQQKQFEQVIAHSNGLQALKAEQEAAAVDANVDIHESAGGAGESKDDEMVIVVGDVVREETTVSSDDTINPARRSSIDKKVRRSLVITDDNDIRNITESNRDDKEQQQGYDAEGEAEKKEDSQDDNGGASSPSTLVSLFDSHAMRRMSTISESGGGEDDEEEGEEEEGADIRKNAVRRRSLAELDAIEVDDNIVISGSSDPNLENVFLLACRENQHDVLEAILNDTEASDKDTSVSVNCFDTSDQLQNSPLLTAIIYKSQACIDFLLEHPLIDLDYANREGDTALMMAVQYEQIENVRKLLINGANKYSRNHDGLMCLDMAVYNNNDDMVVLLNEDERAAVTIQAAFRMHRCYHHVLLGENIRETVRNEFTLRKNTQELFALCYHFILKDDAEHGRMTEQENESAQSSAVKQLHSLIRERDVPIDTKDDEGNTALHIACAMGHTALVDILLNVFYCHEAERNDEGQTAFLIACTMGYKEIVMLFLTCGRINKVKESMDVDNNTDTNDSDATVLSKINSPVYLNLGDSRGITPLIAAINEGHIGIVKTLVALPDVHINQPCSSDGCTPLSRCVLYQLSNAKSISETDNTSTLMAYSTTAFELFNALLAREHEDPETGHLSSDLEVNVSNCSGDTALHLACYVQHKDMARSLLFLGADKHLRNSEGLTPEDICVFNNNRVLFYMLKEDDHLATRIQSVWRMYKCYSTIGVKIRHRLFTARRIMSHGHSLVSTIILQSIVRMFLARRRKTRMLLEDIDKRAEKYVSMKLIAVLGKYIKGYLRRFRRKRAAVLVVQRGWRGYRERCRGFTGTGLGLQFLVLPSADSGAMRSDMETSDNLDTSTEGSDIASRGTMDKWLASDISGESNANASDAVKRRRANKYRSAFGNVVDMVNSQQRAGADSADKADEGKGQNMGKKQVSIVDEIINRDFRTVRPLKLMELINQSYSIAVIHKYITNNITKDGTDSKNEGFAEVNKANAVGEHALHMLLRTYSFSSTGNVDKGKRRDTAVLYLQSCLLLLKSCPTAANRSNHMRNLPLHLFLQRIKEILTMLGEATGSSTATTTTTSTVSAGKDRTASSIMSSAIKASTKEGRPTRRSSVLARVFHPGNSDLSATGMHTSNSASLLSPSSLNDFTTSVGTPALDTNVECDECAELMLRLYNQLFMACPDAVMHKNSKGNLPLHIVLAAISAADISNFSPDLSYKSSVTDSSKVLVTDVPFILVKALVSSYPNSLEVKNSAGNFPLHLSLMLGASNSTSGVTFSGDTNKNMSLSATNMKTHADIVTFLLRTNDKMIYKKGYASRFPLRLLFSYSNMTSGSNEVDNEAEDDGVALLTAFIEICGEDILVGSSTAPVSTSTSPTGSDNQNGRRRHSITYVSNSATKSSIRGETCGLDKGDNLLHAAFKYHASAVMIRYLLQTYSGSNTNLAMHKDLNGSVPLIACLHSIFSELPNRHKHATTHTTDSDAEMNIANITPSLLNEVISANPSALLEPISKSNTSTVPAPGVLNLCIKKLMPAPYMYVIYQWYEKLGWDRYIHSKKESQDKAEVEKRLVSAGYLQEEKERGEEGEGEEEEEKDEQVKKETRNEDAALSPTASGISGNAGAYSPSPQMRQVLPQPSSAPNYPSTSGASNEIDHHEGEGRDLLMDMHEFYGSAGEQASNKMADSPTDNKERAASPSQQAADPAYMASLSSTPSQTRSAGTSNPLRSPREKLLSMVAKDNNTRSLDVQLSLQSQDEQVAVQQQASTLQTKGLQQHSDAIRAMEEEINRKQSQLAGMKETLTLKTALTSMSATPASGMVDDEKKVDSILSTPVPANVRRQSMATVITESNSPVRRAQPLSKLKRMSLVRGIPITPINNRDSGMPSISEGGGAGMTPASTAYGGQTPTSKDRMSNTGTLTTGKTDLFYSPATASANDDDDSSVSTLNSLFGPRSMAGLGAESFSSRSKLQSRVMHGTSGKGNVGTPAGTVITGLHHRSPVHVSLGLDDDDDESD